MSDHILFEELTGLSGDLGVVTLNRPEALNALNASMLFALDKHLQQWAEKKNIQAVVIKAVPGRAFSAGGDIRQAYEGGQAKDPRVDQFFKEEYRLNQFIFNYPKPYIALLDGITMGGGAGISILGSHRIATEQLMFAMPETGIGFFPDVGASYFLSRLPKKMGFYLGLTGAKINYADCYHLGLVDFVVKQAVLTELYDAFFQVDFQDKTALTTLIKKWSSSSPESLLLLHQEEIDICFSQETVEGILEALDKYQTDWCQQTATLMRTKSPTSLKVTLRELQQGSTLSFQECMHMEYRLNQHFLRGHDFYEGVRAVIIDKDQQPKWMPASLEEVTEEAVTRYFSS